MMRVVARRVIASRIATAIATTAVWISAIAAVSSVELANQLSTIDGVMTFEGGPIRRIEAPSSRMLATNSGGHAASSPGHSSGLETVRMRYPHPGPHITAHSST